MTATIHYLPVSRGWTLEAHGVLDDVEALLARGDVTDVVTFCELAIAYLEANADDIDDPAALVRLAERLGELTARARASRAAGPAAMHPARRRPRAP